MLFSKQMSLLLKTGVVVTIHFFVFSSIGCQAVQPQPRQTIPTLKLISETHAPFIYPVNGEVRGPVADSVRSACKKTQIKCKLIPYDGHSRGRFKAIGDREVDGFLGIEWDALFFNRFNAIEPLFRQAGQDRMYYLAISKKYDDRFADRFIQALRYVLDHGDAKQIYARYSMHPQVPFSCALPSRNIPMKLSREEMKRQQTQFARIVYSAEEFGQLACPYDQRFMPYSAGIVKDSALGVLWQNWLHPCLMTWSEIPNHIRSLNREYFGNCNGWRLPTSEELYSINRFGTVRKSLPPFWSADKEQGADNIWTVDLGDGKISSAGQSETLAVIAVCPQIKDE